MAVTPPIVIFTKQKRLFEHRHLLFALAGRDIRARYRQSLLGVYWAVLNPLLQTLVFTVVFARFLRLSSETVPFIVLYFSGVIYWNLFTTGVTGAMSSVTNHMHLLEKHRFPTIILPLASILARLFDFGVSLLVFIGLLFANGVAVPTESLVVVPMIVVALMATLGFGLLTAALNTLYRDVGQVIGLVFTLGFFLTPVIYETATVTGIYRSLLLLNPIATAIHGTRVALFTGALPVTGDWLPGTVVAVASVVVGVVLFERMQASFTEML